MGLKNQGSTMISLQNWPIRLFQVCDVLPYVSTATNGATLLFKAVVAKGYCSRSVRNSDLGKYLETKNKVTCSVLLVPRYGNLVYVIYRLFMFVKGVVKGNNENKAEIDSIKKSLIEHNRRLKTYLQTIIKINEQISEDPEGGGLEDFDKKLGNLQSFLKRELYKKFCEKVQKIAKENEEVNLLRVGFYAAKSNVIEAINSGIVILRRNEYPVEKYVEILNNIKTYQL